MVLLQNHYVATSYVYDRDTDRFLLIRHRKSGKWLAPGGHLDGGEEPYQGAQRELLEEIGVEGRLLNLLETPQVETPTVAQLPSPFCILHERIPAGVEGEEHMHIDFVYVMETPLLESFSLHAAEVSHAQWYSSEEIDDLDTYENVKQVCRAVSALSKRKSF
ncbi:MAG TPA: NUDIX domain-containing protein [Ktedonobacteraceae bacterium]|jgi:8-oxo-dGTP diphosphatase|nr:NUDIX domain-containing protein [Ktedonobacteraceae bacterium]